MTQAIQMTDADSEGATLRLTRNFSAPRETVYRAFTDPEVLSKWWGPKGVTCQAVDMDVRPGGRYHLEMLSPEGNTHILDGEYREVTPSSRLVYTWTWGMGPLAGHETLVTLEFNDRGGATELVLTHEMLVDEEARDLHGKGWSSSLDCLEELLSDA